MQQALLFHFFFKWLIFISHFAVRCLQVRTEQFFIALDLKILREGEVGLSPLIRYIGGRGGGYSPPSSPVPPCLALHKIYKSALVIFVFSISSHGLLMSTKTCTALWVVVSDLKTWWRLFTVNYLATFYFKSSIDICLRSLLHSKLYFF